MDSEPQRIRICLSYDGTDYYGWQKQPRQSPTLQGTLEKCLAKIYNRPIAVVGSGRTDRGVHALRQWAHADVPAVYDNMRYKLQRMTPESIHIKTVEICPISFHAQISVEKKHYIYRLVSGRPPNPFVRRHCWYVRHSLPIEYLQKSVEPLLGTHDFAAFQSTGTPVSTTVRTLFRCFWHLSPGGFLELHIQGDGFLKQMVRNIVGTALWLHEKGRPPEAMKTVLESRDRQQAGPPAPPQGLFLAGVKYPETLDNKCRKL